MSGKKKNNKNKSAEKNNKNKKELKNNKLPQEVKRKRKRRHKFSAKHPKLALFLKIVLIMIILLLVIVTGILVGFIYGMWGNDFEITKDELVISASNSKILDKDGNIIAELSGDENRKIITLDQMSPYLKNAYIAIEDERFYKHNGVDLKRTAHAIVTFVTHVGKSSFGGSSITQQLVKNITKDDANQGKEGMTRKIKEWAKAYQIERMISKDQILELYLNIIFVGSGNYGVEVGSGYYFNKTAADLDLAECAYLAGINSAPNKYDPYGAEGYNENQEKKDKINKKTKTVLYQMLDQGYITQEEYDSACKEVDEGLKFSESKSLGVVYSAHTDATINQVIEDISNTKGISTSLAKNYLYSSGLTIYSTQDTSVQKAMEDEFADTSKYAIKSRENKDENDEFVSSQAAMVVINNENGYVVGCTGELGTKSMSRGLNRATQSTRQTGSSIKPIADLLPGIEEGIINPATVYYDVQSEFRDGAQVYKPKNDGYKYLGKRTLRQAITTSQNIPFVKVMAELGVGRSKEYMKKMGVTSLSDTNDVGLSYAIGGLYWGISPLQMAGAYATIANNGVYRKPLFYTKVEDSQGKVVIEPEQTSERVCSEQTAYIVKNMLTSVVKDSGGTASYCAISGMDVAAKTGTTNNNNDRWLCGFTNYYSAATWYGFDKDEEVRYSGRNPAGQLWSAVMKTIHSGKEGSSFADPGGIVRLTVCRETGKIASDKCSDKYTEIFAEGKIPGKCDAHSDGVKICIDTNLLANEFCPNVETRYFASVAEKEKLGLWKNLSGEEMQEPTTYCTNHNAENTKKIAQNPPTITLKGEKTITLNVGDKYTEAGATAKDEVDGDLTNKIEISGTVNTAKEGKYEITYTVTSSSAKTTTVKREVVVKKKQADTTKNTTTNTTTNSTSTNNTTNSTANNTTANTTNNTNKTN